VARAISRAEGGIVVAGPAPPEVVGASVFAPAATALLELEPRLADELTEEGVGLAGRCGSLSFFFPNSAENTTPTSSIK
jgi:hypothetical protein